jgi:hypothetical protein
MGQACSSTDDCRNLTSVGDVECLKDLCEVHSCANGSFRGRSRALDARITVLTSYAQGFTPYKLGPSQLICKIDCDVATPAGNDTCTASDKLGDKDSAFCAPAGICVVDKCKEVHPARQAQ